eukprot:gene6961-9516_t
MENHTSTYGEIKKLFLNWGSAGLANAITSSILNPMDVSKTRLQIETTKGVRTNLQGVMVRLYKEGGILGLWKPGLSASIIREFLSSGPRAGFYVPVRNELRKHFDESDPFQSALSKILAALTTGTMGAMIANPIDVLKIRLMANPKAYNSIPHGLISIYYDEGFRGLYKGLLPSTLRGAFIAVGELATYDQSKTMLKSHLNFSEGFYLHTLASLITGLAATTVAAPFDLLKTRIMNSTDSQSIGILKVARNIVQKEGVLVLFRGWLPAYLRLGPHALLCFPIFEQIRKLFGLSYL